MTLSFVAEVAWFLSLPLTIFLVRRLFATDAVVRSSQTSDAGVTGFLSYMGARWVLLAIAAASAGSRLSDVLPGSATQRALWALLAHLGFGLISFGAWSAWKKTLRGARTSLWLAAIMAAAIVPTMGTLIIGWFLHRDWATRNPAYALAVGFLFVFIVSRSIRIPV
jgi:hypothetical protein